MGYKKLQPWSSVTEMQSDLDIILEDWETTLAGITRPPEQTQVIQNCVERNLEWWKTTMTIPTAMQLDDDMSKI